MINSRHVPGAFLAQRDDRHNSVESSVLSGGETVASNSPPLATSVASASHPWQVRADTLSRVSWADPDHLQGSLWVGSRPGAEGRPWLNVVQSVDEGYIQGCFEIAGRRFTAMSESGQKGPVYHRTPDGRWSCGVSPGGVGHAVFSSERARFYAYVIETAVREEALHQIRDTAFYALGETGEVDESIFHHTWDGVMGAWDALQEPNLYPIIDRLIHNSPAPVARGDEHPAPLALEGLRHVLEAYDHLQDEVRDAKVFLNASSAWWETRGRLERPVQERIADLVRQRCVLESEIASERETGRFVMQVVEHEQLPVPVEATREVLLALRRGWVRHFQLLEAGFVPTSGVLYHGVREDLQRMIQFPTLGQKSEVFLNAARALMARINEPKMLANLLQLRIIERASGELAQRMTPLTREEIRLRLMLHDWRVARQQVERESCVRTIVQTLQRLFSVLPPEVAPSCMKTALMHVTERWLSQAESEPGLNYQPQITPQTDLTSLVDDLIDEAPPNTSEAAFSHFQEVFEASENLLAIQTIRYSLYSLYLASADELRTLREREILDRVSQSPLRDIGAEAMLQSGPHELLDALQKMGIQRPQLGAFDLHRREYECYQKQAGLFMECRDPEEWASQCRTQILQQMEKSIERSEPAGLLEQVIEATALTRFLIDHFGDSASLNKEVHSANLAFFREESIPPGVAQSLEAWRRSQHFAAVEKAREAAKSTARWYMSLVEEKVWYLGGQLLQ